MTIEQLSIGLSPAQDWDEKYPTIAETWRAKRVDISTLFDFPDRSAKRSIPRT